MNSTDTVQPAAPSRDRALWGWSPADLPANTLWKRRVDRYLPRTGVGVALYFLAIAVAMNASALLPRRAELVVIGISVLAASAWCGLNYWRCRHVHCLVGGVAWPPLAALCFVEAGLGRTLIAGNEGLVFLGILVAAIALEAIWSSARGSNAIGSRGAGRVC